MCVYIQNHKSNQQFAIFFKVSNIFQIVCNVCIVCNHTFVHWFAFYFAFGQYAGLMFGTFSIVLPGRWGSQVRVKQQSSPGWKKWALLPKNGSSPGQAFLKTMFCSTLCFHMFDVNNFCIIYEQLAQNKLVANKKTQCSSFPGICFFTSTQCSPTPCGTPHIWMMAAICSQAATTWNPWRKKRSHIVWCPFVPDTWPPTALQDTSPTSPPSPHSPKTEEAGFQHGCQISSFLCMCVCAQAGPHPRSIMYVFLQLAGAFAKEQGLQCQAQGWAH